jgi:hypothetical protein
MIHCDFCKAELSDEFILRAASRISSARSKASGTVGRPKRCYTCPYCHDPIAGSENFQAHKRACRKGNANAHTT